MKRLLKICFVLAFFLIVTVLFAQERYIYQIHGLEIVSEIELSKPEKVGMNAYQLSYPKTAQPGQEQFSVTMVLLSKEAGMQIGKNDQELLQYAKSTYFGYAKAGKAVQRDILSKKTAGELCEKKIPVASTAEVYILTKKNGDKIVLGFYYTKQKKLEEIEKIVAKIAAGIKEK